MRGFAGGGVRAERLVLGHDHEDEFSKLGHTHADYDPLFARKTADETVNNSTTLQDDNHLGKLCTLSTSYEVELLLIYNSGATPDFKINFTGPAGSSFTWVAISTLGISIPKTLASSLALDGTGADASVLVKGLFIMSTTAGGLQLQWAQNTANASDTIVRTGSYMRLRKVA